MSIQTEAQFLSCATGLKQKACEDWMRHVGISNTYELKGRYPNMPFGDVVLIVGDEIEDYILSR
jgi:hypothetical protein